jgi:hypothetical protein
MPVRILCSCGNDITDDVSPFDKKTRSADWLDSENLMCAECRRATGTSVERPVAEPVAVTFVRRPS